MSQLYILGETHLMMSACFGKPVEIKRLTPLIGRTTFSTLPGVHHSCQFRKLYLELPSTK